MKTDSPSKKLVPWPTIAVMAWLLPGLGHVIAGERARGLVIGATLLGLFVGGLLIGGIDVEAALNPLLSAYAPPVDGRHQPELPYWHSWGEKWREARTSAAGKSG